MPVFLVEHPSEGPFLIDVGYDPSIESDPTRTLGFMFGKLVMKHRLAERSVPEVVRARGVEPSAVSRVLVTRLNPTRPPAHSPTGMPLRQYSFRVEGGVFADAAPALAPDEPRERFRGRALATSLK